MKFKPNQTRTYDGEGFKRRAACLCFKNEKEDEVSCLESAQVGGYQLPLLPRSNLSTITHLSNEDSV